MDAGAVLALDDVRSGTVVRERLAAWGEVLEDRQDRSDERLEEERRELVAKREQLQAREVVVPLFWSDQLRRSASLLSVVRRRICN